MHKILSIILLSHFALAAFSQGTIFVYDQQSAIGPGFEGFHDIQSSQPMGQSFTPSLNAVDFIELSLAGINSGNNANADVYVNLLSGSITGQNIGQTAHVTVTIGFEGAVDFFFSTPVTVTPGNTYYLQPVVQSGQAYANSSGFYHYSGGTAFVNGIADTSENFYFREGIVIPEPSIWALLALGTGTLLLRRRVAASRQSAAN